MTSISSYVSSSTKSKISCALVLSLNWYHDHPTTEPQELFVSVAETPLLIPSEYRSDLISSGKPFLNVEIKRGAFPTCFQHIHMPLWQNLCVL